MADSRIADMKQKMRQLLLPSKTYVILALALLTVVSGLAAQEDADGERDALALYRDGQYERAVEVTLDEIEAMPRNMDSYTVLGWSLLALGRYEDALEYAQRALEISRYDSRVVEIVGEAHYRLGNYVEALRYFEEYAAIAPEGRLIDQIYFFMGEIFMEFGEFHHADIAFSTAVYLGNGNASWWNRLGQAREQAGSYRYALEAYNRALELDGNLTQAREARDRVQAQLEG